jgi:5-methyltetrahydropteroyltriglutamate--homocysteine methyltransferase
MLMERVRTTHVGSLIRPPDITEALRLAERGEWYDQPAFDRRLTEAVADVVHRQAEIGLDVVDDGEMSKPSWIAYAYGRVSGIEARLVPLQADTLPEGLDPEANAGVTFYTDYRQWDDNAAEGTAWVCTGPVTYNSGPLQRDLANLRAALDGCEVEAAFVPALAPGSIYWIRNEYYGSDDELVYAFADALAEEYKLIVDAGFLVSVDDAALWHKHATIRLQGGTVADYRKWAQTRVEALNHALRGIPEDRVRYHICSGSNHGAHTNDAPLRDIVDLVLQVNARYYLIEQGNARHEHEWRIWEEVELPDDKVVVPGVVTHQTMMVEHPELVAQRITRLAGLVGRERVLAGTDCGFAQHATTQRVPPWTQWAKLQALVEGARLATRELWASERRARGSAAASEPAVARAGEPASRAQSTTPTPEPGSPRFSVIDSTTPKLSLADELDVYTRVGAVGIGITERRLHDVQADADRIAASGLAVTGCFLACTSILPPASTDTEGPQHPELSTPEQRVANMAQSMRRLAPLRPEFFYALSGPRGEYGGDEAHSLVVDGLRELADAAAGVGARVALELFHASLGDWSYASTIPDGIAILDAVDRANVSLAVDIWHLDRSPDVLGQLREHASRIVSLHIDDWREPTRSVRDRVLPGDGTADVRGILGSLDAGGFDGWYELEILSDDGTHGDDFPDSLWKHDPFDLVSEGRSKFLAAWEARRTTP